jgi:imidazolonepropionase-like amidohydrolase
MKTSPGTFSRVRYGHLLTALVVTRFSSLAAEPTAPSSVASPASIDESAIVITHATLWTDRGTFDDYEITIHNGRVTGVGKSGALARPAGAHVIDAARDTLLPGLIDAHVHLSAPTRLPPDFAANPRDHIYAVAGRQLLRSGVTAGRIHLWDLPSAITFKADAAAKHFPAPHLTLAGPALFGGQPEWESPTAKAWGVKNVEDGIAKVRRLRNAGMDWLSLHGLSRFKDGELSAIVSEARRVGLKVMVAGDRINELQHATELEVESIDYLDFSPTPSYPTEVLEKLKALTRPPTLVPMPGNRRRFAAYRGGALPLDAPHLVEFLPPAVAAFAINALREDRALETSFTQQFVAASPTLDHKFLQLRATGLPMAVGTDCGSPANFHADAIWWEMETWRLLGVSPDDILRAATIIPAALLGDSDAGHLRIGARGDFVLYRGSPDDGPFTVHRVRVVAKSGVVFVDDGKWLELSIDR